MRRVGLCVSHLGPGALAGALVGRASHVQLLLDTWRTVRVRLDGGTTPRIVSGLLDGRRDAGSPRHP